jgi:hypothetical protein
VSGFTNDAVAAYDAEVTLPNNIDAVAAYDADVAVAVVNAREAVATDPVRRLLTSKVPPVVGTVRYTVLPVATLPALKATSL